MYHELASGRVDLDRPELFELRYELRGLSDHDDREPLRLEVALGRFADVLEGLKTPGIVRAYVIPA